MVKATMIARVTDGLPLAEGLDEGREQRDLEQYKQQAKRLFKKLSQQGTPSAPGQVPSSLATASRMSVETGPFFLHYMIEGGVCYLTLCERGYPKKLAFQYLEELQHEFQNLYMGQIHTVARPYAFIKFDTFIQKTRRQYLDTSNQKNLQKLNDELLEVQQIMTRNIEEVLGVGERLDHLSNISGKLSTETKAYRDRARKLKNQVFMKKYAPVLVIILVVVLCLYLRSFFYK